MWHKYNTKSLNYMVFLLNMVFINRLIFVTLQDESIKKISIYINYFEIINNNKGLRMYNKLTALFGSLGLLMCVSTTSAQAEGFTVGVSGMVGFVTTDGTEKEKTGSGDKEATTASEGEVFAGGSIFAEYEFSNGLAFGIDVVPMDAELGSGKRTARAADAADAGTDEGDYSASADLEDLYTIYVKKTFGANGWYGLLGYHDAQITTTETLPTSTYGNADINGYQVGIGYQASENVRWQASYSDFDDISLASTNDATQVVTADADAIMFKVGISF